MLEGLLARGFTVYTTPFCEASNKGLTNYDGCYCACPGCMHPQGLPDFLPPSKQMKSIIRCAVTKKLIDQNKDYYYLKDVGFLGPEAQKDHPRAKEAIRVILCW